ncbi:hypothetical protein ACA910_010987 [Epithemia clementina (nom. ined.)]
MQGIICANYGYRHAHWSPCLQAFHAHCYTIKLDPNPFPKGLVPKALEEGPDRSLVEEAEGWEVTSKEKMELSNQYEAARPGDHLMTSFQCEQCHFRNCFGRESNPSLTEDVWTLTCMQRANLVAFWSWQPSTVMNNLQEMARFLSRCRKFGIFEPTQSFWRGPFPLCDSMGMIPAIVSLQQSLDPGKNSRTIQWDTMRVIRSTYSNYLLTTPYGAGGTTLTNGK